MTTNFKTVLLTMAGVSLALTSARALTIDLSTDETSPDVLGLVYPAHPSGAAADVSYINAITGLALGGETTLNGNVVWRSDNSFSSLPTATTAGAVSGTASSLLDSGFTYLAVSYGSGANGGLGVWDIGSITAGSTI